LSVTDEKIHLKGSLQVPENTEIYETTYNSILQEAEDYLGKSLEFDFEMIRTANFKSIDKDRNKKEHIINDIKKLHNDLFPLFSLLQIAVEKKDENIWSVHYVLSIPEGEYLTDEKKSEFEKLLHEKYENIEFIFQWVPIAGSKKKKEIVVKELTQEERIQKDIAKNIQELLSRPEMKGVIIEKLSVSMSESEEIEFHARVLYPQILPIEKNNNEKNDSLSLPDVYSLLLNQHEENNKETPAVTPFSIEEGVEFFIKTPSSLSKKILESLELLPYSNIQIFLDFIPYYQEELVIKGEKL